MGQGNPERVVLIERNRILLAVKLFPWSLLLLNPFYFALRMIAGLFAVAEGGGDLAAFPGVKGKMQVVWALLRGQWQAMRMTPRTLAKRAAIESIAVLTPGERRRLILDNRLSLTALFAIGRGTEMAP
jgi:hypothetical protein